jgi:hypothetical protein
MLVGSDDCAGAGGRKIPKEGRLQAGFPGFPLDTAAALDSYNALLRTVKILHRALSPSYKYKTIENVIRSE